MAKKWVLHYQHRHGDDISLYDSAEEARLSTIEIILDWIGELRNEKQELEILELIAGKQFDEAIQMYQEHHGSEWFTISMCEPHDVFPEEVLIEKAKTEFKKRKEKADAQGQDR